MEHKCTIYICIYASDAPAVSAAASSVRHHQHRQHPQRPKINGLENIYDAHIWATRAGRSGASERKAADKQLLGAAPGVKLAKMAKVDIWVCKVATRRGFAWQLTGIKISCNCRRWINFAAMYIYTYTVMHTYIYICIFFILFSFLFFWEGLFAPFEAMPQKHLPLQWPPKGISNINRS